jgi:hypothetical protein
MNAKTFWALSAFALLTACSDNAAEQGPGGVSAEDAKALDVAADKLDAETQPSEK